MITFVLLPLLALMTAALQTAPPTASPIVRSEFIFERAPFPSSHASTIVETGDTLVAAWFGGTKERDPDVGIWLSRRDHSEWSPPMKIGSAPERASW